MDTMTPEMRSKTMAAIKCVSEMERSAARIAFQKAGCRLRHQPTGIYGKPDYANKSKMVAVFVHGCFWHACSQHFKRPKTNQTFWRKKMARNVARHKEVKSALVKAGWRVITVWEHEVRATRRRVYGK